MKLANQKSLFFFRDILLFLLIFPPFMPRCTLINCHIKSGTFSSFWTIDPFFKLFAIFSTFRTFCHDNYPSKHLLFDRYIKPTETFFIIKAKTVHQSKLFNFYSLAKFSLKFCLVYKRLHILTKSSIFSSICSIVSNNSVTFE